ncbi:UNVERIFIED_CONTAM: hypothetical protein HHA_452890 [Hammondia hammondi]|eukprot:XP_008886101.1 hypothetical protein HHA_452890 [Hammondia hammondi]
MPRLRREGRETPVAEKVQTVELLDVVPTRLIRGPSSSFLRPLPAVRSPTLSSAGLATTAVSSKLLCLAFLSKTPHVRGAAQTWGWRASKERKQAAREREKERRTEEERRKCRRRAEEGGQAKPQKRKQRGNRVTYLPTPQRARKEAGETRVDEGWKTGKVESGSRSRCQTKKNDKRSEASKLIWTRQREKKGRTTRRHHNPSPAIPPPSVPRDSQIPVGHLHLFLVLPVSCEQ